MKYYMILREKIFKLNVFIKEVWGIFDYFVCLFVDNIRIIVCVWNIILKMYICIFYLVKIKVYEFFFFFGLCMSDVVYLRFLGKGRYFLVIDGLW